MIPSFIEKTQIPHKPGIYMYKDYAGKVIYVGKAIDLYNRVASYFNGAPDRLKTAVLVSKIRGVETIIVESELEALILEANLIKKFKPKFNIRLTDDKDYLYILVTKEEYPRIVTGRKPDLKLSKKYFGPFPSSRTVKMTLKQLRKIFPWCQTGYRVQGSGSRRPCFYYHLKLCPGACVGAITPEEYMKNINRFSKFMSGQKNELLDDLVKEMSHYSENQQFEEAANIKRIIDGISYITQTNRVHAYLENPNFLEDERTLALEALQKALNLPTLPERIEGYDISNISGTNATGSMVVLTHGEIDKSQYRRFKIHITGKPNDFAMHAEMMGRRLKHKEWPYPDLFIIDGGRGQVHAAQEAIRKHAQKQGIGYRGQGAENAEQQYTSAIPSNPPAGGEESLDLKSADLSQNVRDDSDIDVTLIPIFGLAKRMEWLYPPDGEPIKLSKRSLALRLLQTLRDESHRFAITYHRKLRSKASGYGK